MSKRTLQQTDQSNQPQHKRRRVSNVEYHVENNNNNNNNNHLTGTVCFLTNHESNANNTSTDNNIDNTTDQAEVISTEERNDIHDEPQLPQEQKEGYIENDNNIFEDIFDVNELNRKYNELNAKYTAILSTLKKQYTEQSILLKKLNETNDNNNNNNNNNNSNKRKKKSTILFVPTIITINSKQDKSYNHHLVTILHYHCNIKIHPQNIFQIYATITRQKMIQLH
eukprot:445198_1